jgi:hypothetical protein
MSLRSHRPATAASQHNVTCCTCQLCYCVAASWREFMRALLEGYYVNTHFDYKPASWSEKMRGTIFFN